MTAATYERCEQDTGAQALREAADERAALADMTVAAAHAKGYGLGVQELFGAYVNLRAYSRGMVGAQLLPSYIAEARAALSRIEASLAP